MVSPIYQEIIRQRLIAERKIAGYSQQELADQIQELQSKIAKIESGNRMPDVEIIGKLAEFYGISTDWLFGLGQKRPAEPEAKRATPSASKVNNSTIQIQQHM